MQALSKRLMMRLVSLIAIISVMVSFHGCEERPQIISSALPETYLQPAEFDGLPSWDEEDFTEMLELFKADCISGRTKALYGKRCEEAKTAKDPRAFFERSFRPYKIMTAEGEDSGIITGYYEPLLHGSYERSERYRYPVYGVPDDLITVRLDSVYPEIKGIRLRGRVEGKYLIPYATRADIEESNATAICWVDDELSLFFLEVQGSGRIELDDGKTIFIGYGDQNGHPYRSIGKYLIDQGEIPRSEISLQNIRLWLQEHPDRVDEVLNVNPSRVFFQERDQSATGALGLELTPLRSIAVDPRYVPLGALMFMSTQDPLSHTPMERLVLAQDTGGAIKGEIRADLFWGHGEDAEKRAGKMQEPLGLWVLLPRQAVHP